MRSSNEAPRARVIARADRGARDRTRALASALLVVALVGSPRCGDDDRASLRQDVRLDVAHDPPGTAPARAPFLLHLRVSATPPLAPESAHLWWSADGDWTRRPLQPLAGTERLEAEVPAQPKGRVVRYYFTVVSPLGETVRLPALEEGAPAPVQPAYEIEVRDEVQPWAAGLRAGGALVAVAAVLAGAWAARPRAGAPAGRTGAVLILAGVAGLAAALLAAAVASVQATGSALRDVPAPWWLGLVAWLGAAASVSALRGRSPAGRPARALTVVTLALAVGGAAAVLAGLAAFV